MEIPQYTGAILVLSTTPRKGGEAIAHALVTEHLAACVNILETRSLFRWEGEMNREEEDLLIIKSQSDRAHQIVDRIRQLHPYELPEIIVLPIIGGSTPYLEWLRAETEG
jgi:Uncharacterized protein involved in tolerance to divalent cations